MAFWPDVITRNLRSRRSTGYIDDIKPFDLTFSTAEFQPIICSFNYDCF